MLWHLTPFASLHCSGLISAECSGAADDFPEKAAFVFCQFLCPGAQVFSGLIRTGNVEQSFPMQGILLDCWLAIKYCTNAVRRVPTRCENKQPASSVVVKYCTNTSVIKLQFTRASLSRLSNATMESNECYCWRLIAPISLRKSVTIVNTSHKWKTLQNVAKLIFMEVSESVVSPE